MFLKYIGLVLYFHLRNITIYVETHVLYYEKTHKEH